MDSLSAIGAQTAAAVGTGGGATLSTGTGARLVATTSASGAQPRLVKAAHEFEGQMLKELLKPLSTSGSFFGGEDGEDSSNALASYATDALGQALSSGRGFGIADQIVREVTESGKQRAAPKVTGKENQKYKVRTYE